MERVRRCKGRKKPNSPQGPPQAGGQDEGRAIAGSDGRAEDRDALLLSTMRKSPRACQPQMTFIRAYIPQTEKSTRFLWFLTRGLLCRLGWSQTCDPLPLPSECPNFRHYTPGSRGLPTGQHLLPKRLPVKKASHTVAFPQASREAKGHPITYGKLLTHDTGTNTNSENARERESLKEQPGRDRWGAFSNKGNTAPRQFSDGKGNTQGGKPWRLNLGSGAREARDMSQHEMTQRSWWYLDSPA